VGEKVRGHFNGDIIFRALVEQPNHKIIGSDGNIKYYNANPYNREETLATSYSPSSTVLNIGARDLADNMEEYRGSVVTGTILSGETSGAIARVKDIRLISDNYGDLVGTFFIRDPNQNPPPDIRVKTGQRTFKLTAAPPGVTPLPGSTTYASNAQAQYSGSGTILTQNTNSVDVRNPPRPADRAPTVDVQVATSSVVTRHRGGKDPLAQSFTVDETGAFLTGVDVYFGAKDPSQRLFVELRTVELGVPTDQLVQDYARTSLEPGDIKISADASIPTRITFPSPVYLESRKQYALVFLAPTSDLFEMWVATMGEKTVKTSNLPDVESVVVTKQYSGGSLFKSQNGTIWTASQYQDLTFKLYKAKFVSTGDVVYYNTKVDAGNINTATLRNNAVRTLPRKLILPINNETTNSSTLTVGKKVGQGSVNATGITGTIERVGSEISTVGIVTGGGGYVASQTYTNVPLYPLSGNGQSATATIITSSSGTVNSVSITGGSRGNGYVIGDSLGITTGTLTKGTGAILSVSAINGVDTLYLTNVQGESFTLNQPVVYYSGNTRVSSGTTVRSSSTVLSSIYSGNVFQINQYNHGMHGANNLVEIKNVRPDTVSTQLTSDLNTSATTISVASTVPFGTFEGISTSRGYALVENEVVLYTNITGGVLEIGQRGVNGTSIIPHPSGSVICPYEINGVSLTKINKTFNLPTNSGLTGGQTLDTYYLEFDRENRAFSDNQISFADEKTLGGNQIQASQNHQFSTIIPQFNTITPGSGTGVSAQIRTISGTSAGGSEVSFLDQGYDPVSLNKETFLATPRMVASQVNETARLTTLPLNKSLTLRVKLVSQDPNLSPVFDTKNGIIVLGRNRLNNPITDYSVDDRSNRISGDPHSSVYISKRVDLKQPATSLQVLISACRPPSADFRVLYKLFKSDSSEVDQSYILFPGYDNLKDTNGDGYGDLVINPSRNSGRADAYVRASRVNEFLEYQFSAHDLDPFTGFVVKIVMSSTNESQPLRFKDYRAIALA
jgi:hypothetical protein